MIFMMLFSSVNIFATTPDTMSNIVIASNHQFDNIILKSGFSLDESSAKPFKKVGGEMTTDILLSAPPTPSFSDSLSLVDQDSIAVTKKKNIFKRLLNYFQKANQPDKNKKIDFGFLPGPHYSSTVGFGLGLMATATYSMDRSDTLLPRSNVSLFGDFTTKGFIMMGIRGNNIFKKEKFRLDYRTYIYTFPTLFYGIGTENGNKGKENEASYRRLRFDAMARFMFRIAPNMYVGPYVNFKYVKGSDIDSTKLDLWRGEDLKINSQTIGISYTYDSRDFMLNAYKGWFVQLDQTFTPRFLGNNYCFSSTDLTVCTYRQVWKGGVLAGELHAGFNYGNPSWCQMSEVGNNMRMRGYFEGRYRDKNIIEAQVELRQRIKGRHGMAFWVGGAEVFPAFKDMRFKDILPNAGLGYRWEFKQRINVRLDCGWGKNGLGFMFNINEAF